MEIQSHLFLFRALINFIPINPSPTQGWPVTKRGSRTYICGLTLRPHKHSSHHKKAIRKHFILWYHEKFGHQNRAGVLIWGDFYVGRRSLSLQTANSLPSILELELPCRLLLAFTCLWLYSSCLYPREMRITIGILYPVNLLLLVPSMVPLAPPQALCHKLGSPSGMATTKSFKGFQ